MSIRTVRQHRASLMVVALTALASSVTMAAGSDGELGIEAPTRSLTAQYRLHDRAASEHLLDDPPIIAPPGCNPTFDRTVAPLSLYPGQDVRVGIDFDTACKTLETMKVDVMFVVDRSITMSEKDYLASTKLALGDFVLSMNMETSRAGLITYARTDSISRNLTNDRDDLIRAINMIRLVEENDVRGLNGALRTAAEKLGRSEPGTERWVVIVVAGPESSQPLVNLPTVTQAARNAGIRHLFMMFPDARFQHFVDSASECHAGCPSWRGPRAGDPVVMRYAWGVDADGTDGIRSVMTSVIERVLHPVTVTAIEFWESFEIDVDFDPTSAVPAASAVDPGEMDAYWRYSDMPLGGRRIEYSAAMNRRGATYPVTRRTQVQVDYSDGFRYTHDLPNPDVTVLDAEPPTPVATATSTAESTDTPSPSPSPEGPSASPTPDEPAPTATDTGPGPGEPHEIYLPLGRR